MTVEEARTSLQKILDEGRSAQLRNRLGQFATPGLLAGDVVRCGLKLLEGQTSIRFLDPAFGTGAFYSALLAEEPSLSAAAGFEIDPHYGVPALELWRQSDLQLTLGDFTKAAPPAPEEAFNFVVCNPPYVRHHHISATEKQRLQDAISKSAGARIRGLAGLYCYFMLLAHRWMAPGAIAGWLVPSEFMDVKYGQVVKDYLLNEVTLRRLHRFEPNDVQFSDALVSSAVIWFKNSPPPPDCCVEFTFGGSLADPARMRRIPAGTLRRERKWTRLLANESSEKIASETSPATMRLGDLFAIKRGLATGDNKFFILDEQRILELGLSWRFLRPILPSPRNITGDIVGADESGLPLLARRLFLIDCPLPMDRLETCDPALARYLRTGIATVATGYLCGSRSPWYSQEKRAPAPFLCTYMGRTDENDTKAFRFILNQSNATAANVYLVMYPKGVLNAALNAQPGLAVSVLRLLNAIPSKDMTGEGRVYGGGLHKLEPLELANVPAAEISSILPPTMRRRATQLTL
jgi:adenine-specific DNA-methyltransferase